MPKTAAKTTIYKLIEAGHLARQSMLAPLRARDLEPGDDAILFGLSESDGDTTETLMEFTGLNEIALEMRIQRLVDQGIIEHAAVGPELIPGLRLTDTGHKVTEVLSAHWKTLEDALVGELNHKDRKGLRKILKRFVKLLDLEDN